ncbi:MAG: NAD(P)/FAD-dependent oxidoreductase, partial [Bacteroidaceae bacterium]|nr:NAD(P)/FAD-dependent oxidoreductase [Bacteroidaceae bacterium]
MRAQHSMQISVIGAGAAGCFCAIQLKRLVPELEVTIYEAATKPLAKVSITGGGRCNLTNSFRQVNALGQVYPRGERLMKKL